MSLRLIAKDLYRLIQEVKRLETQWIDAPPAESGELERRLKRLKRERDQLRQILDGHLDR